MAARAKRPAFQWYPGDHRRDVAVRLCSFEARALWREMMDLMHDGEPYGHLTAGGAPIGVEELAHDVGVPTAKVRKWLGELETRKVFSRTDAGVIYSRRMVRDEHIRTVRAESGSKGGNPNLVNQHGEGLVNQRGKQKPTPSSSSSDADAVSSSKSGRADAAAAPLAYANAEAEPLPPSAIAILARMPSAKREDGRRQLLASLTAHGTPIPKGDRARAYSVEHLEHCCAEKLRQFDERPPDTPGLEVLFVLYLVRDTYLEWKSNAEKRAHSDNGHAPPPAKAPTLTFGQELERAREWAVDRDVVADIDREATERFATKGPDRQRDRWCDEQLIERWRSAAHERPPPAGSP